MTNEDKQLLLKDLCARQFYETKVLGPWEKDGPCELSAIDLTSSRQIRVFEDWFKIEEVKPYLRPMSSMTEEEVKEIRKINWQFWKPKNDLDECYVGDADDGYCSVSQMADILEYLNKHHFDYRGLIEKGLALEAPKGMYKTE